MSLDLSAVGHRTAPFTFEYDWKTTVLYALGVGATRDELDYLYEARGPLVLPSFAVVPAYPALAPLVERANADMTKVVHGAQTIRLHAAIPAHKSWAPHSLQNFAPDGLWLPHLPHRRRPTCGCGSSSAPSRWHRPGSAVGAVAT